MPASLRHAARRLRRAPGFATAAALTLALGIGGAAAVFTVVNGVLLQPLPYPRADRLVDVTHTLSLSGLTRVAQSDATYLMYATDNRAFTGFGIYRATSVNLHTLGGSTGAPPERLAAALATPSLFRVLGAAPLRGRGFTDADAQPGAVPVALISRGVWQRTFGGADVLGRHVSVDGVDREIIGVMPASFHFPDARTGIWIPLQLDPAHTNSAAFDYTGIARLRDGATIPSAAADLQRLLPQVPVVYPGRLTAGAIKVMKMQVDVRPLRDVLVGNVGHVLWIVFGAVGLLLLLACANVANLLLARAEGRQRELAVRRALGAGRALLLQDSLSEAFLLALIGAVIGVLLASAGVTLLKTLPMGASIPRMADVHVDAAVLAFAAGVALLATFLVSALPALRAGGASLASLLVAEGRSATGSRGRQRARRALVISQMALALVLLAGAALLARSFQELSAVNPGFDAADGVAFRLDLPNAAYPTTRDAAAAELRVLQAVRAVPGVQAAGIVTRLPLDNEAAQDSAVFIEDHPIKPGQIPDIHHMVFATPGYFAAMGIPLVAGRMYREPEPGANPAQLPREVMVSEAFARRYWTTAAVAIGKRIRLVANPRAPWSTIVGVVGNTRDQGLDQPPTELMYNQLVSATIDSLAYVPRDVAFVVRGGADAGALLPALRKAALRAAPSLPVYREIALGQLLSAANARTTFTLLLLGIAAIVALAIGATGIYGVIAYLVALRTREIGVRLALGAPPAAVKRLVVRRALVDAMAGVALGLIAAGLLTRGLKSLLFSVSPTDAVSLTAATLVLLATAVGAAWVPARRAAALDPAIALRSD
ncbi:MAG TPA: ABC transporter permease [Gemmatimonadaceae bacterium]|nr:ABC transporter permease [Gemmatimonadaceae bacterium]